MVDGKVNNLEVLYEDNHIIVVVKEANILSQKDNTNDLDLLSIVKNYIKVKYHKENNVYCGLVHRLDRPVGGVMVFAKTSKAASRLCKIIADNKVIKKYMAVVEGKLEQEEGILEDYISKYKDKSIIDKNGKYAKLEYSLLDYNNKYNHSLVDINLHTGRHHQIRVQFSNYKHPLCGDQRYNKQDKTPIALYAYYLELYHPVTKELMVFKKLPPKIGYFKEFDIK